MFCSACGDVLLGLWRCFVRPLEMLCSAFGDVLLELFVKPLILLYFVPVVLLYMFSLLCLPSSVTLSYFILAAPMCKCWGQHTCMGSMFLIIAILNRIYFVGSVMAMKHRNWSPAEPIPVNKKQILTC